MDGTRSQSGSLPARHATDHGHLHDGLGGRKILNPKSAQGVFATFYFWKDAPANMLMMFGIVQTIIILAFAAGALRFWSYGAILLMHLVATLAGHSRMIPPYGPGASKTFWAAVPVLAGIATLFVLRNRDRLFSVSEWRKNA